MNFWEDFWSIFWWFVWAFIFIAYLMVLFSIIADVFRDHTLNGWLKAVWVLFLVFVPFITALIYLVARGNGMAERNAQLARRRQSASDAYIRSAAGASPTGEIEKAAQLRSDGTITDAEFEALKARALS